MENVFKWRHYEGAIILLYVCRYLRYALSYCYLAEMGSERGLSAVHTTIFRWVQHFAPELDKRIRPHLKTSNDSWRVMYRASKYLNNCIEQDHRFIKRRVKPGLGFASYQTAWRTLQGYEAMNMIRKGQVKGAEKHNIQAQNKFISDLFDLTA